MPQPRSLDPDEPCDCHSSGPDLALQLHPGKGHNDLAFRSELRAVEQGHRALDLTWSDDRQTARFEVVSNCRHSKRFELLVNLRPARTMPVKVHCDCESGRYRGSVYPIPCKHAALVARSLERRGIVEWHEGLWWHPDAWSERVKRYEYDPRIDDQPDDPFEGLAPEENEL